MKKIIIPIVLCIIVGFLFGKIMFSQYENEDAEFTSSNPKSERVYFIQAGVYSNIENMKEAFNSTENYIYRLEDNKYHVYVAMTKEKDNVEKLKNYYEKKYSIYVKEIEISNNAFLDILSQYDLLLKEATTDESIYTIEKSLLAKYEELKDENKGNTN